MPCLLLPDQFTWSDRRDHAFLLVAMQTGLRLSEMIGLKREDLIVGAGAHQPHGLVREQVDRLS